MSLFEENRRKRKSLHVDFSKKGMAVELLIEEDQVFPTFMACLETIIDSTACGVNSALFLCTSLHADSTPKESAISFVCKDGERRKTAHIFHGKSYNSDPLPLKL